MDILAFDLVLAGIGEFDAGSDQISGGLPHENTAWWSDGLQPRCGVDQIAHHQPLIATGPDTGLPGENTGTGSQARDLQLRSESGHHVD